MASFIKTYQTLQPSNNQNITPISDDTEDLKQKMKQLQQQIQSLQMLKRSKIHTARHSPLLQQKSSSKTNQAKKQIDEMSAPLSLELQNIKSQKVNELVTQIHAKSSKGSKNKLSISNSYSLQSQRQSVNNLKQTLEKIEVSSARKKKKVGLNIYELKGVTHNVDSNIFNVTVAEIMTEQHQKYEMLKQIKQLKDKLKQLEKKKIQNEEKIKLKKQLKEKTQIQQRERILSNLQFPIQHSTALRSQTIATGRIYSRSRILMANREHNNDDSLINSRATYEAFQTQRNSIQLRRNSNPLAWNPQVTLTQGTKPGQIKTYRARNPRISSSIEVQKRSSFKEENKQTARRKPLFQVLKKKQIVNQIQKQPNVQILKEQPSIVVKQQPKKQEDEPRKAIEFLPELKIDKMKKDIEIPNNFIPNFRQYIKQKLLSINLPPQPCPYDSHSDLESLGRVLFALLDIYVDQQIKNKGTQYKSTKYKNCVLFRLNEQKNIVWYYDGKFYFGGWEINLIGQGKKEGFGFEIIPNNYTYQGYYKNNKRDGYGIMFNQYKAQEQKNVIYEGFWKDGLKHGKGYQAEYDLEYLGDFQQGLQTGYCKIKTESTFYEGQIKQSIKQGKGHQILKNGDQYNGSFKQNMFHGLGQYKWRSGAYFYGNFIQGIRKGQGIWISKLNSDSFDTYKGSYDENKKNGYGIYQWANGTIYEGYFKNDLRHDEGLMKYPNGKAAKFMWKDGNKANKIYSKEEETYRVNRNSTIKISAQCENDQENNEPNNQDFQNSFLKSILSELNDNSELILFRKNK